MSFSLIKAIAENYGKELPMQPALDALKHLYPDGHGKELDSSRLLYNEAEFESSFEMKGVTVKFKMRITTSRSTKFDKEKKTLETLPSYHFSFVSLDFGDGKPRGFHPEADNGPFIHDLKDLPEEIKMWEGHIVDTYLAHKK